MLYCNLLQNSGLKVIYKYIYNLFQKFILIQTFLLNTKPILFIKKLTALFYKLLLQSQMYSHSKLLSQVTNR